MLVTSARRLVRAGELPVQPSPGYELVGGHTICTHHLLARANEYSAPAASKRRKKSSTPDLAGPRYGEAHVHFIRDVEQAIDSWLESVGECETVRATSMCDFGGFGHHGARLSTPARRHVERRMAAI